MWNHGFNPDSAWIEVVKSEKMNKKMAYLFVD